ncbi:5-formyltetrahydrofolate cyclo-ligase family protein, partial [Chlamydia psittaci 84-8471/1]
LRNMCTNTF